MRSQPGLASGRRRENMNSQRSLTECIAAELRDEILRGRYRTGDRLPSERELAARFDTHRGAVREALKKLEQLGIAKIHPSGVRAAPIEEASLDIVGHLIELDDPPDPEIVDQLLEAFSGLFSLAARLAAERADDSQRAHALAILDRLMDEDLPIGEEHELVHALSGLFVEASQNTVLALVRRGLRTQFLERIEDHEALLRPPKRERVPLLRKVASAFEAGDGPGTSEALYALSQALRRQAVEILEAKREAMRPARQIGARER